MSLFRSKRSPQTDGTIVPTVSLVSPALILPNITEQRLRDEPASLPARDSMICRVCNRNKFNRDCTDKLCASCCAQSSRTCRVASHTSRKRRRYPAPYASLISEAIEKEQDIWVAYNGGSTPRPSPSPATHKVDTLGCTIPCD